MGQHPTKRISINGKRIRVDEDMVTLVRELNRLGLRTMFTCQGYSGKDDPGDHAYMVLDATTLDIEATTLGRFEADRVPAIILRWLRPEMRKSVVPAAQDYVRKWPNIYKTPAYELAQCNTAHPTVEEYFDYLHTEGARIPWAEEVSVNIDQLAVGELANLTTEHDKVLVFEGTPEMKEVAQVLTLGLKDYTVIGASPSTELAEYLKQSYFSNILNSSVAALMPRIPPHTPTFARVGKWFMVTKLVDTAEHQHEREIVFRKLYVDPRDDLVSAQVDVVVGHEVSSFR